MLKKVKKKTLSCKFKNLVEFTVLTIKLGKKLPGDFDEHKYRTGGLLFASNELFGLTKQLEKCVLRAISKNLTNLETISEISIALKKGVLLEVGCLEHENELSKKIIDIYIVMRAHFLAKSENKRYGDVKTKRKINRENAKLLF
ncbi:hypothetical protein PV327_010931 [Microctonus hyperodae]|uniref:Uncharacterized protein n=1 Tax=Microctonus hyperodae TaxID=165561 RepID=A0AA39C8I7_MICHY|nr:hypothetical protein PV327_010931 [Microctonus hyperodae]